MNYKRTSIMEKGITLVALVITIVVILILAGITINMVMGQDGIIRKASDSSEIMEMKEIKERAEMVKMADYIDNYGNVSAMQRSILIGKICDEFLGSKIQGTKVVTKDNKYDIIVDNGLKITVVKHTNSTEDDKEIQILYELVEQEEVNGPGIPIRPSLPAFIKGSLGEKEYNDITTIKTASNLESTITFEKMSGLVEPIQYDPPGLVIGPGYSPKVTSDAYALKVTPVVAGAISSIEIENFVEETLNSIKNEEDLKNFIIQDINNDYQYKYNLIEEGYVQFGEELTWEKYVHYLKTTVPTFSNKDESQMTPLVIMQASTLEEAKTNLEFQISRSYDNKRYSEFVKQKLPNISTENELKSLIIEDMNLDEDLIYELKNSGVLETSEELTWEKLEGFLRNVETQENGNVWDNSYLSYWERKINTYKKTNSQDSSLSSEQLSALQLLGAQSLEESKTIMEFFLYNLYNDEITDIAEVECDGMVRHCNAKNFESVYFSILNGGKYNIEASTRKGAHGATTANVLIIKGSKKLLSIGSNLQLEIDGEEDNIVWNTSNSELASINNGLVNGISNGEVEITATNSAGNAISNKYKMRVSNNQNEIVYINDYFILRLSGKLTSYELCNTNNSEEELETADIKETLIAENVKDVNGRYFITNDNNLYFNSLDNLCLENVNTITQTPSKDYWLINGSKIYCEYDSLVEIGSGQNISLKHNDSNYGYMNKLFWTEDGGKVYEYSDTKKVTKIDTEGNSTQENLPDTIELTKDNVIPETIRAGYWIDENNILHRKRERENSSRNYEVQDISKVSEFYLYNKDNVNWYLGNQVYAGLNPDTNKFIVHFEYGGGAEHYSDVIDMNNSSFRNKRVSNIYVLTKNLEGSNSAYAIEAVIEFENGEVYNSNGDRISLDTYMSQNSFKYRYILEKVDNPVRYDSNQYLNELRTEIKNTPLEKWSKIETKDYYSFSSPYSGAIYYRNGSWKIRTSEPWGGYVLEPKQ